MDSPAAAPAEPELPAAALVAAAIGAGVVYQIALLAPVAIIVILPALLYGHPYFVGASAIGFVLVAWVLQPGFRSELTYVTRKEAPQLHAWVDALVQQCAAPPIDRIAIDHEINAGALELNRGISLRPTRRVLVLGVPLLAVLDEDALRAVVAHELGHFSHRHGRGGHWLYRTRAVWARAAADGANGGDSFFDRTTSAFAQAFYPWFDRHTQARSRRCEFEADAVAASIVGAPAMARALTLVDSAGERWQRWFEHEMPLLRQARSTPPPGWMEEIAGLMRSAIADPPPLAATRLDDTHPPFGQRCEALAVTAVAVPFPCPAEAAGPRLLGAAWPAHEAAFDGDWMARLAPPWPMQHATLQALRERHAAAGDDAAEAARTAWRLGDLAKARVAARGRLASCPADAEALFYATAAGGSADAGIGVPNSLETAIAAAPAWSVPMRSLLAEHADAFGLDADQRRRNRALLHRAGLRREAAAQAMLEAAREGHGSTTGIVAPEAALLARGLAAYPLVVAAWCTCATAEADGRRFEGLVLAACLDWQAMASAHIDEDDVPAHLKELLDLAVAPNRLAVVWTFLDTAPASPSFDAAVLAGHWRPVKERQGP